MPTFGGGGRATTSQKSGSRKRDQDEDEFDNILDSIVGKEDQEERKREEQQVVQPRRRMPPKQASMPNVDSISLPGSAKKEELEKKKRALFGFSGSSDGQAPKINFGARSQIGPDDGPRGIGTTFDKDQTHSSYGHQLHNQTGGIDSSPIGVIETSNSRRMARRKTPSAGGSSLPRPQPQRVKTADTGMKHGAGQDRFERNVISPPNFDARPDTGPGPGRKPPLPGGQQQPQFINNEPYDEDDEFERDDEQDILGLMDNPDSKTAKSRPSLTPKKAGQAPTYDLDQDHDDEDMDDIFSGGGYVPSTFSKNKADDTKSRDKFMSGVKSDASNEATPITRGRRPMVTQHSDIAGKKKESRDSFSPPEITEGNYMSNKAVKPPQPAMRQKYSYDPSANRQSSIGVIAKEKTPRGVANEKRETAVPLDEVSRAKMELEEARNRTFEMEQRMKKEIENLKLDQKKDILNLESHYNKILESHNREIKKMVDDMNMSIKQERDKLEMINQTEFANKKKQHELELSRQKEVYNQQNSVFENQLKQQIELNKMLDQMKSSSTNIESTLTQLAEDKNRGIEFHVDECDKRERDLMEKLRNIEYETTETEKRVLNTEKEIQEYRVKQQILKQEQGRDLELNRDTMRQGESHYKRVVEETELKQQEAEFNLQRINKEIQELQQEYDDKISAVELERKVVISDRHHLVEMIQMERQNQERKLMDLQKLDYDLTQEELDYEQRKSEFDQREEEINDQYNQLKTRVEVYDDERERFEDEAMKVHQYSLMVQQESERIANFKMNYESMRKELEKAREIIARERAIVKTEKMKHLELLGELDTKQKALELLRTEYIKDRGDIAQQMWSIKRPLQYKVDIKAPPMKSIPDPVVSLILV